MADFTNNKVNYNKVNNFAVNNNVVAVYPCSSSSSTSTLSSTSCSKRINGEAIALPAALIEDSGAEIFSDAAKYSYTALCALSLRDLYTEDLFHHQFSNQTIHSIRQHLALPEQSDEVMVALFQGEGVQSADVYVDLVKQEGHAFAFFIVKDLIYFSVRTGVLSGKYDARTRAMILGVAKFLEIRCAMVEMMEESAVKYLTEATVPKTEEDMKETHKRQRNRKFKRYALVGLATLSGGAILGLTGGLAAPLIGAGVGSLLGGATAAALGSTAGAAVIGSLFGVAGAGLSGFKMKKRVGEVEEFEIKPLNKVCSKNLHVTIAISGWLNDQTVEKGFWIPWKNLKISQEQYCLMYESQYLLELGRAVDYLLSFAVSMAAQEALKLTILSGLISAIAWPASLLTLASVIDNPWGVCCRRSAQIGRTLAEVLISRRHGNRPVTLIGLSLGARVVFYCLLELSQRKGPEVEGLILDAIMLGTPVSGRASTWSSLARVVSGTIVNGYCKGDWLLKFLYRTTTGHYRIAGLEPITWAHPRMKNVDLSHIVTGHTDYAEKIDDILISLGYADEVEQFSGLRRTVSTSKMYVSTRERKHATSNMERTLSVDSFLQLHQHKHHHIDVEELKSPTPRQIPPTTPSPTPHNSSSRSSSSGSSI